MTKITAPGALLPIALTGATGFVGRQVLAALQSAGADAVLVGESLMRQSDVTAALETLIVG